MFSTSNRIRLHDTDTSGILYFGSLFRLTNDALEDFVDHIGTSYLEVLEKSSYAFVVAHIEADYQIPLRLGDRVELRIIVGRLGTSSFTILYEIFKIEDETLVATAKSVHVTIDKATQSKIPIPEDLRTRLEKHLIQKPASEEK